MSEKQQIRIWSGQRKLLSKPEVVTRYRCALGMGYLRLMAEARRKWVTRGDEFTLTPRDVATLTAEQNMLIETVG